MTTETATTRVVYLIGAGASHASVSSVGSPYGILMRHLGEPLRARLSELINSDFAGETTLEYLVNSVIDANSTDSRLVPSPHHLGRGFSIARRAHGVRADRH